MWIMILAVVATIFPIFVLCFTATKSLLPFFITFLFFHYREFGCHLGSRADVDDDLTRYIVYGLFVYCYGTEIIRDLECSDVIARFNEGQFFA